MTIDAVFMYLHLCTLLFLFL